MSNFADEGDAQTLREFLEWLGDAAISDREQAITAFIQERAVNREASFGKAIGLRAPQLALEQPKE